MKEKGPGKVNVSRQMVSKVEEGAGSVGPFKYTGLGLEKSSHSEEHDIMQGSVKSEEHLEPKQHLCKGAHDAYSSKSAKGAGHAAAPHATMEKYDADGY